jgi:hypothetical protein
MGKGGVRPMDRRDETAPPPGPTDCRMHMIYCKHIRGNIYEIATESGKYGRVVQHVLILPESPPGGGDDGYGGESGMSGRDGRPKRG